MNYIIRNHCTRNIVDFYRHVAIKYKHTYSESLMLKNIDEAVDSMFLIEKSLLRRKPTLERWQKRNGTWQTQANGTTPTPSTKTQ